MTVSLLVSISLRQVKARSPSLLTDIFTTVSIVSAANGSSESMPLMLLRCISWATSMLGKKMNITAYTLSATAIGRGLSATNRYATDSFTNFLSSGRAAADGGYHRMHGVWFKTSLQRYSALRCGTLQSLSCGKTVVSAPPPTRCLYTNATSVWLPPKNVSAHTTNLERTFYRV